MRQDRATSELMAARQALAAAEEALSARRRELADYEATKEDRRDKIYDAVIGRTVSREQIDLANEGVARIDEEGVLKADNVVRAEAERKDREAATEVARVNLNAATKNRMKIEEHRAVWMEEVLKAEEARTEGELEDFMVRKEEV